VTGSALAGLLAGILIAQLLALLHGYACITHKGNQVVSGVAINILAAGLTIVFGIAWFKQGGQTPALPPEARFMPIAWPGAAAAKDAPIIGPLYANLISGHNLIVYATLLAVPLVHWIVMSTRFGLRLRAVGEAPLAVDAAGISVSWLRYRAVLICGLMTGIAGTYLSIAQNAAFSREMTAGQGFIALAALIFGKWKAAAGVRRLPDVRLLRRRSRSACRACASASSARCRCSSSRCCPMCSPSCCSRASSAARSRPKAIGVPYEKEALGGGRRDDRAGAQRDGARLCALLAFSRRCGAARRKRQALRRMQRRERRLPAGHLRGGRRDCRDGRRWGAAHRRGAGDGRRRSADRAMRRLPPASERVRRRDVPMHLCDPTACGAPITMGELLPLAFGAGQPPDRTMTTAVDSASR
jgi:hypothetical protein